MIQLVASRRGIATIPYWAALPYLEKGYVVARKVTKEGLYSNLYAAIRKEDESLSYLRFLSNSQISKFLNFTRTFCFKFIDIINEFISTKSTL